MRARTSIRPIPRLPMLVFGLVILLLLAASCSSGADVQTSTAPDTSSAGAADNDNDSSGDGTVGDEAPDTDDAEDDPPEDEPPAPTGDGPTAEEITDMLFGGFDQADQEELEAQYQEEERARQQYIVECMADQGFEYQPVDFSQFDAYIGPGGDLDPTSREFAETYGLGFSTFFEEEGFGFGPDEDFVDPNQEYADSLSPGALDAYYLALYGDQSIFEEIRSEEEFDALYEENPELFEPQGCEGEAFRETSSFGQIDRVYRELGDELDALFERVQADPRIAEVMDAWATCMAEAGYSFTTVEDMYEDMDRRMQPIWESQSFPGEDLTQEEFEAMSDEELDAIFNQPPDIDEELLAEVQEYEIALGVANFDCGGNDQELFTEVAAEYQEAFIAENLTLIQSLLSEEG